MLFNKQALTDEFNVKVKQQAEKLAKLKAKLDEHQAKLDVGELQVTNVVVIKSAEQTDSRNPSVEKTTCHCQVHDSCHRDR